MMLGKVVPSELAESLTDRPSVPDEALARGASARSALPGELPSRPEWKGPLASTLSVSHTFADWLERRGFRDAEATRRFLHPRLADLTLPDGMADRAPAADRLASAIRRGERITVFGDYDCDGMTSAAILSEMLVALGGSVTTLVASRFDGGYGLSARAAERVLASGARLLVTCDCGSSDHESLARLRAAGVDAIVVDHHLVPDEPLPVLAFLNPHRPECGFGYKGLASCGLVLSLGAALRKALGRELELRRWLDLVAIGTIADVAPLDGDNRSLVRAGLAVLAEAKRPGVRALLELARIEGPTSLGVEDVAFRLAPRLNAPGRLAEPDPALELLMAPDLERARALGARVEQAQIERRAIQDRMSAEALDLVEAEGLAERPALVVGREGWNHGIVGIVAGRLADRYARPVVVIGFQDGHGRGSVRGPAGSRLHDALAATSETLVRFGGHQAAAGVELEIGRLAEFREAFEAAVAAQGAPRETETNGTPDRVWLAPGDDPGRVLADFALLEPCGPGNPVPELVLEAELVRARAVKGGHLKLELELAGGRRLSAFGIALGDSAEKLGGRIVLAGRLRPDRYRGGGEVELRIERIF